MFFQFRMAAVLFLGLPLLSGATITPQSASAFAMGAWAGFLLAAPPLMILALCLGLYNVGQVLKPLTRLPVLIILTVGLLYASGVELGLGLQALVGGVMLWWARKGRHFLGL